MEPALVTAKYSYEYVSGDGVPSKMAPGDIFTLVKKSNSDWWYVQRDGEHKGVYLPATYLEETNKKGNSHKRAPAGGHILPQSHGDAGNKDQVPKYRQDGFNELTREMEERMRNNVVVDTKTVVTPAIPEPDYENFRGERPSRLDINSSTRRPYDNSGKHSPHSPLSFSSNTPGVSTSSSSSLLSPGFPSSSQPSSEVPPDTWEKHSDEKGRQYFYNPSTNETTWKAPRPRTPSSPQIRFTKPKPAKRKNIPRTKPKPSIRKYPLSGNPLSPNSALTAGWKQETSTKGETIYIHEDSGEKWYSSKNSKGEVYYYSANREHTTWELPSRIPVVLRRQTSEDENQSELRAGVRRSRSEGLAQRPVTIYGTGTFGGPVSASGPAFPTDSNLVLNVRRRYSDLEGSELSPEAMAREKEGVLNRGIIEDRKKPSKTKMVNSFAVLTGSTLVFYKDQKYAERAGSPLSTPEYSTDLWGADIDVLKNNKQGKKSLAFELHELSGQSLLLQADSEKETISWHEAIQGSIKALGPANSRYQHQFSPEEGEFMFSHSNQGAAVHHKKSGENIRNTVNRTLLSSSQTKVIPRPERDRRPQRSKSAYIPPSSRYERPNGDSVAIKDRNKIKHKLKSFITRRPTIADLQKQGIMREENVFGRQLVHLCEREKTAVPKFVMQCVAAIDKRGLQVDGIYRVSGNLSLIQKLRFQIDSEKPVDFDQSPYKEDIHVISGSLKLYFRELPEPLLSFKAYDALMAATRLPDKTTKLSMFKEILKGLPMQNFQTLKFLLEHLSRIVANSKHNRMTAQSVAIVFGPTLMWSEKESFNIAMNMVQQNQCIEFILTESQHLF